MTALTKIFAVCSAFACLALTLALVTTAHAQATINDCEKIQAADAYNQCLAKFGPPAKSGNLEPERPGDIKSSSAEAAAGGGKPSRSSRHVSGGRRHGRGATAHRGRGHGGGAHGGGSHGGGAHGGGSHGRKRMTISVGK